jgi:hypothetical protein
VVGGCLFYGSGTAAAGSVPAPGFALCRATSAARWRVTGACVDRGADFVSVGSGYARMCSVSKPVHFGRANTPVLRMRTQSCVWLLLTFHTLSLATDAQTLPDGPATARREPIGIYLDCKGLTCDHDFLRTDIAFVTHLRDRHDAHVHILITAEPTAEGGSEVTLQFIGQKDFRGVEDSLRYVSRPADTADQLRQGLSNAIKRGLVRYANHTAIGEGITVLYTPSASSGSAVRRDPWNRWTFATAVNGFMAGEEMVKSTSLGLSLSASRTTDTWKTSTSLHSQFDSSTFEVERDLRIKSIQRSYGFSTLVVWSVNDHLSIGGRASAVSSRFLNQTLAVRLAPALEYNVFPYRESTSRMLTVEYTLGGSAVDYDEETIFGKSRERLLDERLLASLRLTQRWGSVEIAAEGAHYLHDWRKHRGTIFGSIDWNLAKGLSLLTSVDFKRINDQLFLPARGASEEEILLRQRQLSTSYTYSASFGIRYTFGSPLAQIVNRRFAGSVGTMNVIQ